MGKFKFRYNPESCRYEKVGWNPFYFIRISLWIAFLILTFFISLAFLHNKFTTSTLEESLKRENKILSNQKLVLKGQFEKVEVKLANIKTLEADLHQKLFSQPELDMSSSEQYSSLDEKEGPEVFRQHIGELNTRTALLKNQIHQNNLLFTKRIHIEDHIEVIPSLPTLLPLPNEPIHSLFCGFGSKTNPFHRAKHFHQGVDFSVPRGTSVLLTASGKVVSLKKSTLQAGRGNWVEIDHGNGYSSRYIHLETILVKEGQFLKKGVVLGTVGNSGGSISPHLHYEILKDGKPVDPVPFFMVEISAQDHQMLKKLSEKETYSLD